jgi:gamma-glutamylcyclotransferase (GGCT)/AIG2-like uncharacterized protein YtfP
MSHDASAFFVYGTLMQGEVRCRLWPRGSLRIEPATTLGRLYDLGPYPALVEGTDTVLGELWHFEPDDMPETLEVLDRIECYGQEGVDLYVRRVVECRTLDGNSSTAYVYFLADAARTEQARLIRPNDRGLCSWRERPRRQPY